ncbi:MAG: hypothetical protein WDA20_10325 [Desulfuromonadales bacterium]|jgi:hypothetical protein
MPDEADKDKPAAPENGDSRFPELADMQREIERRITDNRRFLERFLDENFIEGEDEWEEDKDNMEEL